ncbi:Aste57867_13005 [Aphanomyces stellatus]|uniref:Aste57867_13005 protein n=1 Tax=Aphanomyces stellatus TaxID=120398 RepID=A0A485KZ46_9STRA|nr:hypothetical protein As57867_012957 [Aphanomyces stellatus]VFT89851.1 Aste57867_13005 [Aphanomyces stellatus]
MVSNPHHRRHQEPHLPRELLWKLVIWIDDTTTFFSFADALGSARGPLEPLWQLGLTKNRRNLWPQLHLSSNFLQAATDRAHIEASLLHTHIPSVGIAFDGTIDVSWLRRHIQHPTTIDWYSRLPLSPLEAISNGVVIPLSDWFTLWAKLPLTKLVLVQVESNYAAHLEAALPRLCHLTSLSISADAFPLAPILHLATTSLTLVELHFATHRPTVLSRPLVAEFVRWLRAVPVKTLGLRGWQVDDDAADASSALLTALFQHPTLSWLSLMSGSLGPLAQVPASTPTRLRELRLVDCDLSPASLDALANLVAGSSLEGLHMSIFGDAVVHMEPNDGMCLAFARLLQAATECSQLKSLSLDGCGLVDSYWETLGPLLQSIPVDELFLRNNEIGDNGIGWIAQGIQINGTVRTVNLANNQTTKFGLIAILQAMADRSGHNEVQIQADWDSQESDELKMCFVAKADELGVDLKLLDRY